MKVKTSELTGEALDWATSAAQGDSDIHPYSTNWEYGGPIIEREGICLHRYKDGSGWSATYSAQDPESYAPTPLIAAMRCYVASKLGDEVEIPEELLA